MSAWLALGVFSASCRLCLLSPQSTPALCCLSSHKHSLEGWMNGSLAAIVRRGLAPPWSWVCLGFFCYLPHDCLCTLQKSHPCPQSTACPHLEAVRGISLQPGLAELALLSFFINHPLPPPDPACPAPLNLLQFVSSERCRESCLQGQVWLCAAC